MRFICMSPLQENVMSAYSCGEHKSALDLRQKESELRPGTGKISLLCFLTYVLKLFYGNHASKYGIAAA